MFSSRGCDSHRARTAQLTRMRPRGRFVANLIHATGPGAFAGFGRHRGPLARNRASFVSSQSTRGGGRVGRYPLLALRPRKTIMLYVAELSAAANPRNVRRWL